MLALVPHQHPPDAPPGKLTDVRLTLRDCRPGDVAALDQANPSPSIPSFHVERFARQQAGLADYILAWHRGTIVGHVLLKWEGCADSRIGHLYPACPEIACLEVFPSTIRGNGIGTAMIGHAEHRAATRRFGHIGLGVAHTNPQAAALYARLGYTGHQAYIDRYRCVDSTGTIHNFAEPCVYLTKKLLAE